MLPLSAVYIGFSPPWVNSESTEAEGKPPMWLWKSMVPDKKPNEFKDLNPENCPEALERVNIWVALLALRTHSVSSGPTSPAEGPSRRTAVLGQYYHLGTQPLWSREPIWGRQRWPSSPGQGLPFPETVHSVASPHPGWEITHKERYNTGLQQRLLHSSLPHPKNHFLLS